MEYTILLQEKKSTNQPLHIARIIQDYAEQSGYKLCLILLDRETQFQRNIAGKQIEASDRLNVPDKIPRVIESIYRNLKFRIRDREGNSTNRKQRAGIRQGCPLSPYLFVCVMTVIVHDIHLVVDYILAGRTAEPFDFWELLYADDTMLIGSRARELNILLKEIINKVINTT